MIDQNLHKKRTISGIKWNLVGKIISEGVLFLMGIILMRLLSPKEFGLIAMVTVITGFLNVFKDFGLGNSLIHKKNANKFDFHTLFWVTFLLGALQSIILLVSSSFIADFYDEPKLIQIAIALSSIFSSKAIPSPGPLLR